MVSALAIAVGLGGVGKTYAQTQQPPASQEQQAPQQQQQTPPPPTPSGQQVPAATGASPGAAQPHLPQIVVTAPKKKPKPIAIARPQPAPQPGAETPAQAALDNKMQTFDQGRNNLLTPIGASTYTVTSATI